MKIRDKDIRRINMYSKKVNSIFLIKHNFPRDILKCNRKYLFCNYLEEFELKGHIELVH